MLSAATPVRELAEVWVWESALASQSASALAWPSVPGLLWAAVSEWRWALG